MSSADYVIVGAGSAGCVLANRLTEDPSVRVIVLEAGGADRSPNIKIPAAFAEQFHTKLDWDYSTEPEPHVDNRRLYLPRGKSLGGSSSMNAMLYVRGRPLDYDLWEEQGADGWGWEGLRPYFLKAENDERGASEHHGVGGPVNIQNQRSPRHVNADFIKAAEACGIPRSADYNSPEQDGVGMFQTFQKNGRRWSCADAYLRPAMKRDNLEVITHAEVQRLELSGTRVTGVRLPAQGQGARRARRARGDPVGGRVQLAADPDAVGHRPGRAPPGGRRARRPRAARRRAQPPGPPVPHDDVGDVRHPLALQGRRPEEPGRVAPAPLRSAVLDRRRVRRLRPHPPGPAGGRHPVPRRRRVLREPRPGGVRRPLLRHRTDAADGRSHAAG